MYNMILVSDRILPPHDCNSFTLSSFADRLGYWKMAWRTRQNSTPIPISGSWPADSKQMTAIFRFEVQTRRYKDDFIWSCCRSYVWGSFLLHSYTISMPSSRDVMHVNPKSKRLCVVRAVPYDCLRFQLCIQLCITLRPQAGSGVHHIDSKQRQRWVDGYTLRANTTVGFEVFLFVYSSLYLPKPSNVLWTHQPATGR